MELIDPMFFSCIADDLELLSFKPGPRLRISQENPFVIIISRSFSVQWYISQYRFPRWKKMGRKHWKLGYNDSSWLCSFQMECFLGWRGIFWGGIFFVVFVLCFVLFCFAEDFWCFYSSNTFFHRRKKKNNTISCILNVVYQLLDKKDLAYWSFQKLWTFLLTFSWQFQTPDLATFLCGWNPRSCFLANSSLHSLVKAEWHRCFLPHTHYLETFRC